MRYRCRSLVHSNLGAHKERWKKRAGSRRFYPPRRWTKKRKQKRCLVLKSICSADKELSLTASESGAHGHSLDTACRQNALLVRIIFLVFQLEYVLPSHRMGSQSSRIQASIPSEESRLNEQESTRTVSQAEQEALSLSNERAASSQSRCVLTSMISSSCWFGLTASKLPHWISQFSHRWRAVQSYSRTPHQPCYKYQQWASWSFCFRIADSQ